MKNLYAQLHRLRKPLPFTAAVVLLVALGYFSRHLWLPRSNRVGETTAPAAESGATTGKIIVGDQAQKNLNLIAKALKADTFWKSVTLPGTVVDRPSVSDREVVAPASGIVSAIHRVPGETAQPGEALFTLKLSSDVVHETQADLFKASQDIKLAQERLKRLQDAGEAIARSRVTEVESEIKRLEAAAKSGREHLLGRGLSTYDIDRAAEGNLVSQITVVVPASHSSQSFELQELKVEMGQKVEAGESLCLLANHQALAIEGQAFRDETPLLERSVKERWPVEVDFQESAASDWPPLEQELVIHHVANTIDPATRTFAFLLPLENQSKAIDSGSRRLWRFRAGQKAWLNVRVEKLESVFVLPAEAVVREGPEAYVFTQNVNTFERKGVHVLFQDRQHAVIANDGSLPTYRKNDETWTLSAIVQNAAAQLNRMTKAGTSGVPKGYHIHADGSLHKNEDESK